VLSTGGGRLTRLVMGAAHELTKSAHNPNDTSLRAELISAT